ncbi:similar to Saccharomyces cerevisiae YOL147C PEX11 Peroxisomal membrane protein required for medium-chain fatty acid oxidation and peroxisome proliferation [Maudiozyma saulgeensis]|uniref:Similar to Saccharomyces cerevisiae YOL147C PEX11 Peroxisomal membrane protein required for medium-chain fatty acid oxidation and peroxisome proliferation n=1 Tax=Maudiozyma saulgeensis TaxID=1789683 RepID=A0A1X7R1L7_9SACH|nr:similar to Saccharomyces cerevisiae YOL147C PEX11 Peroxisomal membrane protein required for medium-chain fatty acid oxidation and peroxisome proliferation [Kazachstania saulgeensis]
MVCDTLVYHPLVTKLVKFLDTTAGREKILRLLQYLCRFLAVQQGSTLSRQLQAQFTIVRKVLRFLKPLNHIQAASKIYDQKLIGDSIVRLLNIIKNLCYAGYLTLDQINLLRMFKLVPTTTFSSKKIPRWTNWFWFFGLISGLLLDLRNIQISDVKLKEVKDSKEEITDKQRKDLVKATYKEKFMATRRLLWDSTDMFIVLNNLGYLTNREQYVALAGVVTSMLGLSDMWKATKTN